MLVTNVSLYLAHRYELELIEVAAAEDILISQSVFTTLIDEPAAAGDSIDAYLGEIMLEAASADAVVNAGAALTAAIDEAAAASSAQDALGGAAIATTALVATQWSVAFVTPSPNSVSLTGSATLLTV